MYKNSPKEQYIIYPIFNLNITITNVILYLFISAFLTILQGKGIMKGNILSNNWGILSESLYRTILQMIENFVGRKYSIYLPLFYSLFHIILFSNLLGLIPYSTTSTAEIVQTLSIAFTLQIGIFLIGILTHQLRILTIFLPSGTPLALIPIKIVLEILGYIFRIISLGLRLGINMITGHTLVKVIVGGIWVGYLKGTSIIILAAPLILLTTFLALEILISYLQAYILVFITILTLKDITKS